MKVSTKSVDGKLIGLSGYAAVGKDAFADALCDEFGYVKVGWADPLYEAALMINPVVWILPYPTTLRSLVGKRGWTAAKRIPGVRKYLQFLGTEVVRDTLGEDVFVNKMRGKILELLRSGRSVVVTNCRFDTEIEALEKLGGTLVWVSRPGIGPVNDHVSESFIKPDRCALYVHNNGTVEDLREWATLINAAVKGHHYDPNVHVELYSRTVKRAIASSVRLILETAAPTSAAIDEWVKKHKVECDIDENRVEVYVDGERAGRAAYCDNVIELDMVIAR
jgi:hypothetical protein